MKIHDIVFIRIPAKTRILTTALGALREYAADMGFDEPDISWLSLALEEAFCHAISLGYGGEEDALRVVLGKTTLGLQITLTSKGVPLDDEALPQFDQQRLNAEGDMTGMSAFLMRNSVDKATFTILKNNRRKITLFKRLPLTSPASDAEAYPKAPLSGSETPKPSATIRRADHRDAQSISRLALRAHGSLLFNTDIYYPNRISEMLAQGEMHSVVLETAQGEILGHGALVADAPGGLLEEMTYGIVDKRLRGKNYSKELVDALLADAQQRGLHGVYALAVCNHVLSQRSVLSAGFRESALLLAASPPSRSWARPDKAVRAEVEPERIANLLLSRYLKTLPETVLFPPKRHEAMIRRIHEHVGCVERIQRISGQEKMQCRDAELHTKTMRIDVETDVREGWAWIVVLEYGRQTVARITGHLRQLSDQGICAVYLMLPLDVPATATMTEDFEEAGFFFSGITFSPEGREHLALQYINGKPGLNAVEVYSPFARELLDYLHIVSK